MAQGVQQVHVAQVAQGLQEDKSWLEKQLETTASQLKELASISLADFWGPNSARYLGMAALAVLWAGLNLRSS